MNEEFRLLQQAAEQLNWAEEKRQLEELEQQEQERNFFVAFVGRYSAGKSCLINNLLGRELLPHGTTETTTALTYLRFGEEEKALIHTVDGGVQQVTLEQVRDVDQRKELWEPDTLEYLEVFVNSDLLRGGMILLDTPGINTVIQRHEQLLARSLALAARVVYVMGGSPTQVDADLLRQMKKRGLQTVCVRTHFDQVNPTEEDPEQTCASDRATLEKCGVDAENCYFVSNLETSKYYARKEPLRSMLMECGSHAQEELEQAIHAQTVLLAERCCKGLAERQEVLNSLNSADREAVQKKLTALSRQIESLEQSAEKREEQMNERLQEAERKLSGPVTREMEENLDDSIERVCSSDVAPEEMAALLKKEARNQMAQLTEQISSVSDCTLQQTNSAWNGTLENIEMEQLPELEVDRFATLQMEQDSEREALLRQMQALKENKEQIEEWLTGIKDTPEYQEVEEAVREANEDLRTSENAYENMGEYVPQMRQVEQKGMKPSDVAEGVGRIAEMAFLLIPGSAWGSAAGSAAKALKNSGRVGTTLYKGLTVVANNSKVLNAVDAVNDTVTKTNWMSKLFTSKAKRQEMQDLKKIEALAAGAATKGVVALDEFKRSQGYDPDSDDNPTFLDMLSVPYWTKKVGKKFDAPPKYVDVGDQEGFKEEKKRLQEEIRQKKLKAFEMKQKLKFYDSQAEEMEAKRQAAVVDEEELERELKKHEQEIAAKARKDALEKWRENCGQWYRDQLQPELKKMIADARVQLPERLTYYQEKRLRSVRQRLEEKKAEYNKLMDAPAGEHAEDLERTTTLLNRIREVYENG